MGASVCDYIHKTIDALPGGAVLQGIGDLGGADACDAKDDLKATKTLWQLNGGPTLPDRDRDRKYVGAP